MLKVSCTFWGSTRRETNVYGNQWYVGTCTMWKTRWVQVTKTLKERHDTTNMMPPHAHVGKHSVCADIYLKRTTATANEEVQHSQILPDLEKWLRVFTKNGDSTPCRLNPTKGENRRNLRRYIFYLISLTPQKGRGRSLRPPVLSISLEYIFSFSLYILP